MMPVAAASRERTGRSGAQRLQPQGPVAEIVGVARQRRPHRQSRQRRRDRQAVARRARPAARRRCRRPMSTAIRARSGGMRMARPWSNPTPSPTWPTARRSAIGDNDERYGAAGAFLIEAGISSSYHIANFFGLTERIHQPKAAAKTISKPVSKAATEAASRVIAKAVSTGISREHAGSHRDDGPVPAPEPISPRCCGRARGHSRPGHSRRRASRHRCRRGHHPRADRRRVDEIDDAAGVQTRAVSAISSIGVTTTSPPATCRVFSV